MKKTIIIVDKVSLQIQSQYEAEAANQAMYGGPWGDAQQTAHIELPEGGVAADMEIENIDGEIVIVEDEAKKAARLAQLAVTATEALVGKAMDKGAELIKKFAAENIRLGITQAGKTKVVRQAMAEATAALSTGSLYDAMDEMRAIPEDKKDATFITDERLLAAINEIEAYLGLPASEEL